MDDIYPIIREVLRPLGITRNYRGYHQFIQAVALVLEDEIRLTDVEKQVYAVVAKQTHSKPENVERNLRTAISCAWRTNPPLLEQMAKFQMLAPPSASQFLDIIATYILRDLLGSPYVKR